MRTLTTFVAGLTLALFAGCGSEPTAPPPEPEPVVEPAPAAAQAESEIEKLARIAAAIKADPSGADAALSDAGMTAEEFEAAMFALAKDPAKTAAFADAMR